MIRKTITIHKRYAKSWRRNHLRKDDRHIEQVVRETWWFLFIPLYSRDAVHTTNL